MIDKIKNINFIALDEKGQEFCLSNDNGFKTFNLEDFKEKKNSDNMEFKIGNVSEAHYFPQNEDLIIFLGAKDNKDFPPNTLVFFDMKDKHIIFKHEFNKEITSFKCILNFIIIAFGTSLIIYSYDKTKKELEQKEEYIIEKDSFFECWVEKQEDVINNLYLAYPYKENLKILTFIINEWSFEKTLPIASPVNKIQNLFYVHKLNQIFISDETAKYIYSFDIHDGKIKLCLKRGTSSGFITSIALLNDGKFLAVNNLDRTIHIFDLDINNYSFSVTNLFSKLISGIQEIYPKMRIYYKDLFENIEGAFYQKYFCKNGSVLYSNNDDELTVIAYNGFAFKININYQELKYNIALKEEYTEKKMKNLSLYNSGF